MQIHAPTIEVAANEDIVALMLAAANNAQHMTPALQNAIAGFLEYQAAPKHIIRGSFNDILRGHYE